MDEQYFDYRFYSYIYKDKELKLFFDELTQRYNKKIKCINEWAEDQIKEIYSDFAPIKEQILFIGCATAENNIKIKVLKKLIEFSLIDIEQNGEEYISLETRVVIDNFIKINKNDFCRWYSTFEKDFDCFFKSKEKTKKLTYRRTTWN